VRADLIRDLLTDLRDAAVASLTDPPDRQYVGHGNFAHDCELVATRVVGLRTETADAGTGQRSCAVIPVITLELTVMRCYPTVDGEGIPDAAELTTASLTLADDAVAITGGLLDRWEASTLFSSVGDHCDRVVIGNLDPVGPGGAIAGWRVTIEVRT
jgi:hypothetical protein